MTTTKDYYDILGVAKTADDKAIKSAYRKLARKYHPDVNKNDPTAEARFKEVAEAFAVLSDKDKRAKYDRGGHEAFGAGFNPFEGVNPDNFQMGFDLGSLADLFSGMGGSGFRGGFGGGGARRMPRKGRNQTMELPLPFRDAVLGRTVDIVLPVPGAPTQQRLKVKIPAGIEDGGQIRLAGRGEPGQEGGPAGDVLLKIRVQADPMFSRDGKDLTCNVPVDLAKSALGGKVLVPKLEGSVTIQIPPGTKSGQKFRIRGAGVPSANGRGPGDLHAVIQIHPPKTLDERSRELLEEFQRLNPEPGV